MACLLEKEMQNKQLISYPTSSNLQSADQGLMIRSSVPEEPTGETNCSTYVLSRDNKVCPIENNTNLDSILYLIKVSKIDFIVLPASYLSISL